MQLPAAVSPLTRELIMGAPRSARVVAAFRRALYLRVDAGPFSGAAPFSNAHDATLLGGDEGVASLGAASPAADAGAPAAGVPVAGVPAGALASALEALLPVVLSDGLMLPTALRLGVTSGRASWPVSPGDEVVVGGGRVAGQGLSVHAVRDWRPARVASGLPLPEPEAGGMPIDRQGDELAGRCAEVSRAVVDGDELEGLVVELVGAGPGLTPSGDDALCGVLLAFRAWAPPPLADADPLVQAVTGALHRTTALSASLLAAAAAGYAVPQAVSFVHLLARTGAVFDPAAAPAPSPAELTGALEAVLAIGHSSGRDLVAGITGAVRVLTETSPGPASGSGPQPEGAPRG